MQPVLLDSPITGLQNVFPEKLFILKHEPTQKFGCYSYEGVHGLACFSTQYDADVFGSYIEAQGMESVEVSFDEARIVAQDRPMPIVSIMLLDDMSSPQIHYVR